MSRAQRLRNLVAAGAWLLVPCVAIAQSADPSQRRSGYDDMSRDSQALQRDDTANPAMLWVLDGEALWTTKAGTANTSCADCHQDATTSMKGVAARYPAYDATRQQPIDLQGKINACRETRQRATPFALESRELLALSAYVGMQSRGMAIAPSNDARLEPFRKRGEALYNTRLGQLNFSCANCHDYNAGQKLASAIIPQGHPTGYPLYRLEWQGLGSLQRRLRGCFTGVRAEPYAYGAPEYIDLELFLMSRAKGMAIETPAVRP
jgi:sulfur-oxidizing protein SoxA